ncbi:MAG: GNAT family N-acetyltransferase [Bacteroidota bacterium]
MNKQIQFRPGGIADLQRIATLHAQSWQTHYQGMLRAAYLQHEVEADRLRVWTKRLEQVPDNQVLILAETAEQLCGFVCVYLGDDPQWGALLDNLHVVPSWQHQGLGRALLKRAADAVHRFDPQMSMYLWVLAQNEAAIGFYDRLGGHQQALVFDDIPGGGKAHLLRYVWTDLELLLS